MVNNKFLALDVGEKRIGVAKADSMVKISIPLTVVEVDGHELESLAKIIKFEEPDVLVVGYPRNQSGDATSQTLFVENFVKRIESIAPKIVFQDESVTSIAAEDRLKMQGKPYTKGDIDMIAASLILQDYLESNNA